MINKCLGEFLILPHSNLVELQIENYFSFIIPFIYFFMSGDQNWKPSIVGKKDYLADFK